MGAIRMHSFNLPIEKLESIIAFIMNLLREPYRNILPVEAQGFIRRLICRVICP
jgi:hypothetical protein